MKRVLVPLPDRDFDVTEVAVPWKLLRRAGHEVVFATEQGAVAAGDPRLISGVIFGQLGADAEAKAFYAELLQSPEFQRPLTWSSLRQADFDALLLPGGHAPGMRQYLGSELLQSRIAGFWNSPVPIAAICHGVLVLARSRHRGKSVLHTARTTSLTKWQERLAYYLTFWKLGKYYRTYPAYVEDEVKAALDSPAQYQRGPITWGARGTATHDDPAFVVEDGRYVSARWPGDAYLFARKLIDRL
jgi:putative intracellular protease/amidase